MAIDAALLQRLLSGQGVDGWTTGTTQGWQGGDAGNNVGSTQWLYDIGSNPNTYDVYDTSGNKLDTRSKESSSAQLGRFLAGAATLYGAGSLLNGGLLGFGGAPGAAGGLGDLGAMDALGSPGAFSADGVTALPGASGVSAMRAGEIASYAPGASVTSPAVSGLSSSSLGNAAGALGGLGQYIAPIAGALAGAAGSKDQQQTSTREPWGPAQQWIKDTMSQGQALQQQYQRQPFSQAQQAAYNNFGGLLNAINSGAGGLTAGANATASGANNFDRSNPRKALTGSSFNLGGFAPGLLSLFGGNNG